MPQSLSKILLHVVFSTKNREETIPQKYMEKLHAYLAGACRANKYEAFRIGGTKNHVHIACTLHRTLTIGELMKQIKMSSSQWMKKHTGQERFAWQAGYGAFSLGQSQLKTIIRYIDNQEEHHKTVTFQEELLDFLKKYKIEYNENYLWD